ncbi:nicotinate phosphoribosyltransferase [Puteibacter caeruleilacunae]|nr:nicotinate phosphoribosyltransferase [Puteibacter caeruleilacunae]
MYTLTDNTGLYTDYYELTMAQGYFFSGKAHQQASFDYYYRTNPFKGGFMVFAGLEEFLHLVKNFKYDKEDLEYLASTGLRKEFLDYLKDFRFRGTIYSVNEGEIVFPNEPLIRVDGNLIEAQLIETLLLNYINFQSLIATKAFRIKMETGDRMFADFGLRRAQGLGGIQASRAAIIGGASSTSNVYAGLKYNIPVSGTQAHSWIQGFDDELDAFRTYARINPDTTVLLVDTYNTLKSGIPHAITVAKELEERGHRLIGVRLDSGDLAYLSKRARKMLDDAGLQYVKIIASNQLNEHVVKSLNDQKAPIDGFGIGTEMVTAKPEAALDGVYKLVSIAGSPRMKISENIEKVTLPGTKTLTRYYDKEGLFFRDAIHLAGENHIQTIYHPHESGKFTKVSDLHGENLHSKVFENGTILASSKTLTEIHQYLQSRAALLPEEVKRFTNPHIYKVGISEELLNLRNSIRNELRSKL